MVKPWLLPSIPEELGSSNSSSSSDNKNNSQYHQSTARMPSSSSSSTSSSSSASSASMPSLPSLSSLLQSHHDGPVAGRSKAPKKKKEKSRSSSSSRRKHREHNYFHSDHNHFYPSSADSVAPSVSTNYTTMTFLHRSVPRRHRYLLATCPVLLWIAVFAVMRQHQNHVASLSSPYGAGGVRAAYHRTLGSDVITTIDAKPSVSQYPYTLLRDVDEPFSSDDVPYFWHIHKSAGSSMKHVLTCLDKVQTRRISEDGCSDSDPDLKICTREWGKVVNADASSFAGIQRAVDLQLTSQHFPDLVVDTSRVYEALPLFTKEHKGRLFALFRHPVERAVSKYYYTRIATWERNYKPVISNMTLIEFANSRYCYNNWMTRRLVHKMQGDLSAEDLTFAKEILRTKMLVLLTEDMEGSANRLLQYFGWDDTVTTEQRQCMNTFVNDEPLNVNTYPKLRPGSTEWNVLKAKNLYDLELMSYARELYREQGELIAKGTIGGGGKGTIGLTRQPAASASTKTPMGAGGAGDGGGGGGNGGKGYGEETAVPMLRRGAASAPTR